MYSLEINRLVLRPFKEKDVAFLDYLHSDMDVVRFTSGFTRSHQQNRDYIKIMLALYEQNLGHLLVIRKSDNTPIGRCGYSYFTRINDGNMDWFYWEGLEKPSKEGDASRFIELGYSFAKEYWGNGFATEAAFAVAEFGLYQLGMDAVHSLVDKRNTGSIKVAERIGAREAIDCMVHDRPALRLINRKMD